MDDKTIGSLRQALAASPDNIQLLSIVLEAHLSRSEGLDAWRLLSGVSPERFDNPQSRLIAARVCLAAERPDEALRYAGDDPSTGVVRARALLALDRKTEALHAYEAAVAANPTAEDPDLAAFLRARTAIHSASPDRKLKVISNDDTDDSEMARLLMPDEKTITFADVGGLDGLKSQIRKKIILPFQKPSLFTRFKKNPGGGILLYGPPGCGKTMMARATAGECHARFFSVAISDVLDMYIGESEQKLHAVFEKARQSAPAVLFFDEIEALGGKRQYSREATSSKLVSQFLAEMDGFAQDNKGLLILGATNVPWAVDAAFRRPGRFDRVIFVPPPDQEARKVILQLLVADRPKSGDLGLDVVAKETSGMSGADLRNLVETAVDEAIEESIQREVETPVTKEHLRRALKTVKPTTLEWLTTARNYARYANESGHYDDVLDFLAKHGKG